MLPKMFPNCTFSEHYNHIAAVCFDILRRCVVFFKNNIGEHFALLRWYTEVGTYPADLVSMLPHLRLADPFLTKSYDVLPVSCIMNGALLVPNGQAHWALMSPREHAEYELMNG